MTFDDDQELRIAESEARLPPSDSYSTKKHRPVSFSPHRVSEGMAAAAGGAW